MTKTERQRLLEAVDGFSDVINSRPRYDRAFNHRGVAYRELGMLPEAIADFDRAIQIFRDFAEAYYNRALAKERIGQLDAALSDLRLALLIARQRGRTTVAANAEAALARLAE